MLWCLPTWHTDVLHARDVGDRLGALVVPGCYVTGKDSESGVVTGVVPCDPEKMRATVEKRLVTEGLWPKDKKLSLEVYALARAIAGETGGRNAVPEEQVAIAEATMNRVGLTKLPLLRQMMRDGRLFSRQTGSNPAVSSSKDPWYENIVAAEIAFSGRSGNFARGATNWFSRKYIADPVTLYNRWTTAYKGYWVGHLPNIDAARFMLLKLDPEYYETPEGKNAWKAAYREGLAIMERRAPSMLEPPTISCATTSFLRGLVGVGTLIGSSVAVAYATWRNA